MSQLMSADPGKYSGSHGPADVGSEDIFPEHIDSEVLIWLWKCITDVMNGPPFLFSLLHFRYLSVM